MTIANATSMPAETRKKGAEKKGGLPATAVIRRVVTEFRRYLLYGMLLQFVA